MEKWVYWTLPGTHDVKGVSLWIPTPSNEEQDVLFYRMLQDLGGKSFDEGDTLLRSFVGKKTKGVENAFLMLQDGAQPKYYFQFTSGQIVNFVYTSSRWWYSHVATGNTPGLLNVVPIDGTSTSLRDQMLYQLLSGDEESGKIFYPGFKAFRNVKSVTPEVPISSAKEVQS